MATIEYHQNVSYKGKQALDHFSLHGVTANEAASMPCLCVNVSVHIDRELLLIFRHVPTQVLVHGDG